MPGQRLWFWGGYEAQSNERCHRPFAIRSDSFPEDGPSDERRAVCDARLDMKARKLGFDRTEDRQGAVYTMESEPGSQKQQSILSRPWHPTSFARLWRYPAPQHFIQPHPAVLGCRLLGARRGWSRDFGLGMAARCFRRTARRTCLVVLLALAGRKQVVQV